MIEVTKAALSRELGITKARVSQYVRRGLPVLASGKVDRDAAVKWIAANHANSGRPQAAGVNRAASISNRAMALSSRRSEPATGAKGEEARTALRDLLMKIEAIVGYSVVAAGGTCATAYSAASVAKMEAMGAAHAYLDAIGAEEDEIYGTLGSVPGTSFDPDWIALAGFAGGAVDVNAWDADRATLPYWVETERVGPAHPWEAAHG